MVAITVNKNVWGYGFAEFITPWVEESGFIPPVSLAHMISMRHIRDGMLIVKQIMTNMSLITLWCSFGILFYYVGKTFRRWSKNDSVHRM